MDQPVPQRHDASPADPAAGNLLMVRDLKIAFDLDTGVLEAVRGISFRVPHGKTVALVGESGSGKSVVAQAIMGILPKIARISAGQILFDRTGTQNGNGSGLNAGGVIDIAQQPRNGPVMRSIRGGAISIIFQEPMTSLSPVHTIGDQIGEALKLHRKVGGRAGQAAGDRHAAAGRLSRSRPRLQDLSVRAVRGPAPARDDRDGADLPADAADRR